MATADEPRGVMLRFPKMPTDHILALLIAERDKLNRAIETLSGPIRRRGRPPKSLATLSTDGAAPTPKRRPRTAAQRKAQAARMKLYWAARKKQQAKAKT